MTFAAGSWTACQGSSGSPPRVAVPLSDDPAVRQKLAQLRRAFAAAPLQERQRFEPAFRQFVEAHPEDPVAAWARVYLAWLADHRGDGKSAARWLARAESKPALGPVNDFARMVRASRQAREGQAEAAYVELARVEQELLDPELRLMCLEQLVRVALATARPLAALGYLEALAGQLEPAQAAAVEPHLEALLFEVPAPILEQRLRRPQTPPRGPNSERVAAARRWMRSTIRDQLVGSALGSQDVELARRLLGGSGPANAEEGNLEQLASRADASRPLFGRRLGLLLETHTKRVRGRSADALEGVASQLGARPQFELRARQVDASTPGEVDRALEGLMSDGVGVVVLGLSEEGAAAGKHYARATGLPTLSLHPAPGASPVADSFWVVGEHIGKSDEALRADLTQRLGAKPLLVGGATDDCFVTARSKPPQALVLSARPACAEALLLQGWLLRGDVGLGLDAWRAELPSRGSRARLWARQPVGTPLAAAPGPRSWFGALGADAAQLALRALAEVADRVEGEDAVAAAEAKVTQALKDAPDGSLSSSSAQAFNAAHQLDRKWATVPIAHRATQARSGLAELRQP